MSWRQGIATGARRDEPMELTGAGGLSPGIENVRGQHSTNRPIFVNSSRAGAPLHTSSRATSTAEIARQCERCSVSAIIPGLACAVGGDAAAEIPAVAAAAAPVDGACAVVQATAEEEAAGDPAAGDPALARGVRPRDRGDLHAGMPRIAFEVAKTSYARLEQGRQRQGARRRIAAHICTR